MPPLTGTVTVIVTVTNLADSAAWYRKLFDAEEVGRYVDADGCLAQVVLRIPQSGPTFCLVQHSDGIAAPFDERRPGLDHLEFTVPSKPGMLRWAARLDALGIPHSGVKAPDYTANTMLTFRDPDNIQLEFFCPS